MYSAAKSLEDIFDVGIWSRFFPHLMGKLMPCRLSYGNHDLFMESLIS